MTKSIRLTDIQLVLLATAAQRDNGSLLPPPETVGEAPARIRKAVEALIRRGLAKEIEIASSTEDGCSMGVAITEAGRAAIGIEADAPLASSDQASETPAPVPPLDTVPPSSRTKSALVLEMLRRESGATLDELTNATSWLPHTTRAALTGLRKKGHAIDKRKRGDVTCYHLMEQA